MKIYVASSWRNTYQPAIVVALRQAGHEVYDFRNPALGDHGFHWSQIDSNWKSWSPDAYRQALSNHIAESGFSKDKAAMDWCEVVVLVLPSGRSSHVEAAHEKGRGKRVLVYIPEAVDPELMYKLFDGIVTTEPELLKALEHRGGT